MAECLPADKTVEADVDLSKLSLSDKPQPDDGHCDPLFAKPVSPPENSAQTEEETPKPAEKPLNMKPGAVQLRSWLNQMLRVTMSDGRVLIGMFFCTDRDANIILGACSEYLPEEVDENGKPIKDADEPRILGLVMVPGKHIVNISVDETEAHSPSCTLSKPLSENTPSDEVM